ncbi:hypothetical protein F8388_006970, partial [Cannabis sativa]
MMFTKGAEEEEEAAAAWFAMDTLIFSEKGCNNRVLPVRIGKPNAGQSVDDQIRPILHNCFNSRFQPSALPPPIQSWDTPTSGILTPRAMAPPCVWKPPWFDQEVWSHVLQTVLPQQRQGDWLHQDQSSLIGTHTPLKSRE